MKFKISIKVISSQKTENLKVISHNYSFSNSKAKKEVGSPTFPTLPHRERY